MASKTAISKGSQQPPAIVQKDDGGSAEALRQIAVLLDALQCGALLIERSGRIFHANRPLCDMMQLAHGDLIGQSLESLYPSGGGRSVVEYALTHFDEPRQQEFFLPRADGSRVPVIVSGRRLEGDAPLNDHRIVTVIDISHQKHAENQLHQSYADIARLTDTVLEQALELKRYSAGLEQRVKERTIELHRAHMQAIYMLAVASEAKDLDTGAHVRRIERYTLLLARELGLSEDEAERIAYSAILHDVGKIQVPDEILRKPAALTEAEWKTMRQHTIIGEHILSPEPFFDLARSIARSHHENWDGSGYPDGLRAHDIPLAARIVRVADVYDALTNRRPYKPAWTPAQAASEIESKQGRTFDSEVVRAFLSLLRNGTLSPPAMTPR